MLVVVSATAGEEKFAESRRDLAGEEVVVVLVEVVEVVEGVLGEAPAYTFTGLMALTGSSSRSGLLEKQPKTAAKMREKEGMLGVPEEF